MPDIRSMKPRKAKGKKDQSCFSVVFKSGNEISDPDIESLYGQVDRHLDRAERYGIYDEVVDLIRYVMP